MEKGSTFSLDKTISETRDELGRTVRGLSDGGTTPFLKSLLYGVDTLSLLIGATALGPALLVAVSMASQKAGSKVIICTDGLANVGMSVHL